MDKTPFHLWIVGFLSLLWNAGGAFDYVMTRTNAAAYLAAQPPERLAMLAEAPFWFDITWAIGVWLSVIGSLLLLVRSLVPLLVPLLVLGRPSLPARCTPLHFSL